MKGIFMPTQTTISATQEDLNIQPNQAPNTATEQSIYEKNLDALTAVDPFTAVALMKVKPNEKFEVFISSNDAANINMINKEDFKPLFVANPVQETVKRFQELDEVQFYPHLYFLVWAMVCCIACCLNIVKHSNI